MQPGVFKFAQFGVHPDDQGQGVGQHIMRLIEARARELGATELSSDTSEEAHQLIAMYTKLGYRQVDIVDWDATNYKSVVLSKTLYRYERFTSCRHPEFISGSMLPKGKT
jgi:N-acetylglutamate synthase-like GNAT family acetyltransferase